MGTTQLRGSQILDGSITAADVDDALEKELTKVRVTTDDLSADFLSSKVVAGTGIAVAVVGTSGSNQTLRITATGGGGGGGSSLTVSGTLGSTAYADVPTTLVFDDSTGFQVADLGSGTAKITIASHFKNIVVSGSSTLVATGSDTFEVVGGDGISVKTSLVDTTANGITKELKIDASVLSSSLSSRITTLESAPAPVGSHSALTNLLWVSSSHTASTLSLPAFGTSGQAIEVKPPTDGSRVGKALQWISNDTLGWVAITAAVSFVPPSLGPDSFDTVEYASGVITVNSFDIVAGTEGAP